MFPELCSRPDSVEPPHLASSPSWRSSLPALVGWEGGPAWGTLWASPCSCVGFDNDGYVGQGPAPNRLRFLAQVAGLGTRRSGCFRVAVPGGEQHRENGTRVCFVCVPAMRRARRMSAACVTSGFKRKAVHTSPSHAPSRGHLLVWVAGMLLVGVVASTLWQRRAEETACWTHGCGRKPTASWKTAIPMLGDQAASLGLAGRSGHLGVWILTAPASADVLKDRGLVKQHAARDTVVLAPEPLRGQCGVGVVCSL